MDRLVDETFVGNGAGFPLGGGELAATGRIIFSSGPRPDKLVQYSAADAKTTAAFYADFYRTGSQALAALRRLQIRQISNVVGLDKVEGRTLLDIGAGNGVAVNYLNETFKPAGKLVAYGIEPAVDHASDYIFRGDVHSIREIAGLPERFDYVSFLDVLEHFESPAEVLRSTRSLLTDEGLLIVKVPSRIATIYQAAKTLRFVLPALSRKVLRRLYQIDYPPPHFYYFDEASLRSLLESTGYEVKSVSYLSETPIALLWERLWGMNPGLRVLAYLVMLSLKLVSLGRRQECVLVTACKR